MCYDLLLHVFIFFVNFCTFMVIRRSNGSTLDVIKSHFKSKCWQSVPVSTEYLWHHRSFYQEF
uniref:Uncharacterized protein n=1 Tax=Anguilla anguilla TaxID=7936 RepID=A0A0E9PUJ1_ANGAN